MKKFRILSVCMLIVGLNAFAQTTLHVPAGYASIQAAVNAASSPLDVIQVAAGTYSLPVSISKSLTLRGPNAGISGTGARVAEAELFNAPVQVSGNVQVRIEGFRFFQNSNANEACLLGGSASVQLKNSVFERSGLLAGANSRSISIAAGSGTKTIEGNLFTGDVSGGLFSTHRTWNSGIYLNGNGSTVNLLNNSFRNCRTAINLDDFNAGISLNANTFENNGTHLSFGGVTPTSGQFILGANHFTNVNAALVNLSNVNDNFRLDITSSTIAGSNFSALPLSSLFQLEQTMFHRGRSGRKGLVTYVGNRQYVVSVNPSIQAAINYGQSGQTIHVGPGTYNENIHLNKKIDILGSGSGSDPAAATIITQNASSASDATSGVLQLNASGSSGSPLTIRDIRITANGIAGISVGKFSQSSGVLVEHVLLENVSVWGSNRTNPCTELERGLYVDKTSSLRNLMVNNCAFNQFDYGWYLHKEMNAEGSVVQDISVRGTEFNDNILKALYAEKLGNALFDGCRVMNNGDQAWAANGCDQFRAYLGGFDVNLKAGNYQNISIRNSEFTGNGTGQSRDGSALTLKARSDAPTYSGFPASLTGVNIENCLISGNERGVRFVGTGPLSAALVRNNSIQGNNRQYSGNDGSAYGNIINSTSATISATCNWLGSDQPSVIASGIAGAVTFSPFLLNGTDGNTATGFQPSASCGEALPCAFTLVCSNQGKMFNGGEISAARSNTALALTPQKNDASGSINFFSLGFGGSITLKSTCPVKNGSGNDITVWETTFGTVSVNNLSERARVYASQDGINYYLMGTATYDGSFDLQSAGLAQASYFRIVDATSAISGQSASADGYDVDGIEVLNGYSGETTPAPIELGAATSVCNFSQGKMKNNGSISASRSLASNALGLPQNDQTINFVSLGFGGEICLKFDFAVFDGPGGELKLVETTFGNSACSSYPEKAQVSVSFDGQNWNLLGEFCQDQDQPIDITAANSGIQYVKIKDVSNPANFSSGFADGFDVDALVAISSFTGNEPCAGNSNGRRDVNLYDETSVPDEALPLSILPSADGLQLQFSRQSKQAQIEIRNAMGQLMESRVSTGVEWETELVPLSGHNLKPGVYFASVVQNGQRETVRFLR